MPTLQASSGITQGDEALTTHDKPYDIEGTGYTKEEILKIIKDKSPNISEEDIQLTLDKYLV